MTAPTTKNSSQPLRSPSPMSRGRSYLKDIASRPYFDYFSVLIITVLLSGIGVAMVMSASMATSMALTGSVWSQPRRQLIMVAIGFVVMLLAIRTRPTTVRKYVSGLLILSFASLILVLTPLGTGLASKGSQSWIAFAGISFQPSEIARMTIVIWGAHMLASARGYQNLPWQVDPYKKLAIVSLAMFALIVAERDIGMAMNFALVVVLLFFYAGLPTVFFKAFATIAAIALIPAYFILQNSFRGERITVWKSAFFGYFDDPRDIGYQSYQGYLSLADGSLFGVGLGQSRAKWFYLPEAKNDFIFAIIGEELGLIGAFVVVALFAWLAIVGLRIAKRSQSSYLRLLAPTLASAIVFQAFYNVAYVLGLAPITGIQLPMISSGGTSALITLGAMGLIANAARYEPEAISAMQSNGRPTIDAVFMLPEPTPVDEIVQRGQRMNHAGQSFVRGERRKAVPRRELPAPRRTMRDQQRSYPPRG
ncbi:putative peptidoglycan glycosyltransferase FtsW [Corynebacterium sp. HS2168-gen11]|uniref:peptidoglycan glycosyltransferase FtsW n=1 Tax=Corynebacterium sp. HS2168-gen11 TaxID=2974027 RepID=UPI00216AD2C9|nr:putative peptidoglycan glycosyltransferase FtsW [Corynebacterium sp. HS2168-gen11]MCS4536196.1 putative lipid II flippase FtsW [Corynebacterium sp. HS2168-gen11]